MLADLSGVRLILTTRDDPRVLAELGDLEATVAAGQAVRHPPHRRCPGRHRRGRRLRRGAAAGPGTRRRGGRPRRPDRCGRPGQLPVRLPRRRRSCSPRPRSPASTSLAAAATAAARGRLSGVYRRLPPARRRRRTGSAGGRLVRPILAPLAVALGDGLDTTQLASRRDALAGQPLSHLRRTRCHRGSRPVPRGPATRRPVPGLPPLVRRVPARRRTRTAVWPVDAAETHAAIVDGP